MSFSVVSVGELLYDVFPEGEKLGGAPSNFAFQAASMGGDVVLVSAVGEDERGRRAVSFLEDAGVGVTGVRKCDDADTGIVQVALSDGQPTYDIVEDVAWDQIDILPETESALQSADLVCWGTLGQRSCRSRKAHRQLFDLLPGSCVGVCDINFRQNYHSEDVVLSCLHQANILKLSDEEVPILRGYLPGFRDVRDYLREIRQAFSIDVVVMTMGSAGCRILAANTDFSVPATAVNVANTVGAGDAFTAAFALHYLAGHDLRTCAEHGNKVGAYVATQDSGMPRLPDEFRVNV
jgi:fructokinase